MNFVFFRLNFSDNGDFVPDIAVPDIFIGRDKSFLTHVFNNKESDIIAAEDRAVF